MKYLITFGIVAFVYWGFIIFHHYFYQSTKIETAGAYFDKKCADMKGTLQIYTNENASGTQTYLYCYTKDGRYTWNGREFKITDFFNQHTETKATSTIIGTVPPGTYKFNKPINPFDPMKNLIIEP